MIAECIDVKVLQTTSSIFGMAMILLSLYTIFLPVRVYMCELGWHLAKLNEKNNKKKHDQ